MSPSFCRLSIFALSSTAIVNFCTSCTKPFFPARSTTVVATVRDRERTASVGRRGPDRRGHRDAPRRRGGPAARSPRSQGPRDAGSRRISSSRACPPGPGGSRHHTGGDHTGEERARTDDDHVGSFDRFDGRDRRGRVRRFQADASDGEDFATFVWPRVAPSSVVASSTTPSQLAGTMAPVTPSPGPPR